MKNKPELLMPAGNLEKLKTAYRFGADACYMGEPNFSLRYRENQTDSNSIKEAIEYSHKIGKKIYITINTYPHNDKIKDIIKHIKYLRQLKPDAIIFSDPGVFNLLKKYYPEAILHLSVQATVTNYETVKFWQNQGVSRIILARELSLKEIAKIHKKVPDIEIECFVHGAICMAYSGRCLLSNYFTARDPNQGDCSHVCRWHFKVKQYVLEEGLRKGKYLPIYENDHGSHILSSRDLCLIEHLKDLHNSGVVSFKIEGRAKNVSYVATISRSYRQAIDDMVLNKKIDHSLAKEVATVSNRGFFTGFYFEKPSIKDHQLDANRTEGTHEFLGVIRDIDPKNKLATVEVKGQIKLGDTIEIFTPRKTYRQKITEMFDYKLNPIEIYHPGLDKPAVLKIKTRFEKGDIIRKKL